ncbi:MAG: hypothetical protein AAF383_25420, partial [Cyanobacteria bacterium P01_A01_bin.83]
FPTRSLDEASVIRDWLLTNKTVKTAKKCLTQLKACCKWSIKEGLIETNPFDLMTILLPKGIDEDTDVNPFSKQERNLIIQNFESDRYYSYYRCEVKMRLSYWFCLLKQAKLIYLAKIARSRPCSFA